MQFDSTTNTVTLAHGERLRLHQLEGLVRMYALDCDGMAFVVPPEPRPDVNVLVALHVPSLSRSWKSYTIVRLDNDEIVCSCPDFQHRQAHNGGLCKHIRSRILDLSI